MTARVVALAAALSACVSGPRRSSTDSALEGGVAATFAADYVQTRAITRNSFEENPIMGRSGDRLPPEAYFPVAMGIHTAAMIALPPKYRRAVQLMTIGFESLTVANNWRIGYTAAYCF